MMREIKFRAWEPLNKKMHKLDFALYEFDESDINTHKFVLPPGRQGMQNPYAMMNLEAVKVMQYTGLKDKKGHEIYEGDIVRIGDYPPYEVIVNQFSMIHCIDNESGQEELFKYHKNCRVIGNIHENPELLEGVAE